MENTATLKNDIAPASTGTEATNPQAEIERLQALLGETQKKITELRRAIPPEKVENYSFTGPLGETVHLSDLFGDKEDLIVIHNMGKRCSYCTLWADGFSSLTKHLEDRAGFVVTSPDDHETQRQFARDRGWQFKMYSTKGTTFKHDMGFEPTPGEVWPGVSTFRKNEKGEIFHVAKTHFGPGDPFCSIWHLFDMLAEEKEWHPSFHYSK